MSEHSDIHEHDERDLPNEGVSADAEAGQGGEGAPRPRVPRRLLAVLGALTLLVGLAIVVDVTTASPALCGSCHSMEERTASWRQSPHATVSCVACHEPPRKFYGSPASLASRTKLLARDISWQLSGAYAADDSSADEPFSSDVADENCLQCHDPNREATSGFRILIKHAEHAERNGSCVSCHRTAGHPSTAGSAISLMEQCMQCHGQPEQPKASAKCGTCHPKGYELLPASHKKAEWRGSHGKVSLAAPKQCELCHTRQSCTKCHGVEMPHPKSWAKGKVGHAVYAKQDRAVCTRCHEEKPDLCSMCHHKAYDPAKGNWVKQHYIEVREKGTGFCLDCHSPLYCADCHVNPRGRP